LFELLVPPGAGTGFAAVLVILVQDAQLGGGEVVGERHSPEHLDVRRVPARVVRHALPELHAVGQVRRALVHVQRSPHLPTDRGDSSDREELVSSFHHPRSLALAGTCFARYYLHHPGSLGGGVAHASGGRLHHPPHLGLGEPALQRRVGDLSEVVRLQGVHEEKPSLHAWGPPARGFTQRVRDQQSAIDPVGCCS